MATIWICGNEPDAMRLAQRVLRQLGHEVRALSLARMATELAARHLPELLILDLREDAHGLRVLETLEPLAAGMRLLVTTTAAQGSGHVAHARRLGAEIIHSRPLEIELLERKVSCLFRAPAALAEGAGGGAPPQPLHSDS
jgi:DNA-binding response OmpR family regulator